MRAAKMGTMRPGCQYMAEANSFCTKCGGYHHDDATWLKIEAAWEKTPERMAEKARAAESMRAVFHMTLVQEFKRVPK